MIFDIAKESVPSWASGDGSVGTTPQALGDFPVLKKTVLRANSANTGTITIGPSAVQAGSGFILAAGNQIEIFADNIAKIFVVGSAASQNFSWIAQ